MDHNGFLSTIRLLTLNLGLLRFPLRGRWRLMPIPGNEERLAAAPAMLSALEADIIALQEVYSIADRQFLVQSMVASHPFIAKSPTSHLLVGNGLMLFSRFPILRSTFTPFRGAPRWTGVFWKQGFLVVDVDLPVIKKTRLVNVHLAASLPFADPASAASEKNRNREIDQLLSAAADDNGAAILVGDFNTSEKVYPESYRRLIEAGYHDAFVRANKCVSQVDAVTWDSSNPLNAQSRFRHVPSQRIDHVFVHNSVGPSFTPVAAQIVLRDRSIKLKTGQYSSLSDHYGMLVTFSL
jgi:endonuclease/exonuclease/phosphatase family metal-dependent hydrolase